MQGESPAREPCEIALLVDEEIGARDADGRFVVDPGTMEAHVLSCVAVRHARVTEFPFDPAITPTVEELRALAPRLVFI